MNQLKKNCVISAVGKNSLHREWIKGNPDFDLHLIVYDNSYNEFYNDPNFITHQKGYKLRLVYNYLQKNPEYLEKYDYLFFPDDDLLIDSENISELFKLMNKYHLQIAQPALSDSYYFYEHVIRDKFCVLHYTNFVEIMAPCFSREALNKVLFTFNANSSGWGIEIHWPHLIGFTGKEIAIIDEIHAIHTRPIQSFSKQNMDDFNEYISKYKLKWEILETGCILKNPNSVNADSYERLVASRETYKQLNKLVNEIADCFVNEVNNKFIDSIGLQGLTGKALFLANYSRISEKRKYLDSAFSILEIAGGSVAQIKADLNFQSGLPGFSWCIEYFAQHRFIENRTYEILEEISSYLNDNLNNGTTDSNLEKLIGIARHYIARMSNCNFDTNKKLNSQEQKILITIVRDINKWSKTLSIQNAKPEFKHIIDSILLLNRIKVKKVLTLPETDEALNNVIEIFKRLFVGQNLLLLESYILVIISEETNDAQLKNKAIQEASNYRVNNIDILSSRQIMDLYLLHKLYQKTGKDVFKDVALQILNNIINQYGNGSLIIGDFNKGKNYFEAKQTISLGLILVSVLSDEDLELNDCIL